MTRQGDLGTAIAQKDWPVPEKVLYSGRYVDLEPLSQAHAPDLASAATGASQSFTYLRYGPFSHLNEIRDLIADLANRPLQPFWAVTPKGEKSQGWLSICDVYQTDGSIEIGSIWFAPTLQGTRAAREAIFLLMCHAMDDLGYERLVWRCQAQNSKSYKAAENLGFTYEGTWRKAAVVDGWQRDVAWFSILKEEWAVRKDALAKWLSPENFDVTGRQINRLGS